MTQKTRGATIRAAKRKSARRKKTGGKPPSAARMSDAAYERHKARARARMAQLSQAGRDIGEIPPPADPARKAEAIASFRRFCEIYLSQRFVLAWSPDHLRVIARIEHAVLHGGLFALAMPRGFGKTSLCEAAVLWAALTGRHRFIVLIAASGTLAEEMLDSIKSEIETNDLLAADWPEVCVPVAALDGIANRAKGQLCCGERTYIQWGKRKVVFPTISGSAASGCAIRAAGLTSAIRGLKHKTATGETVRPSLAIIDDPQTDQSARSESQCDRREKLLSGAILGLSGPQVKMTAVMPCTVVRPGDLADRMLDREKHPDWHGERSAMLKSMPENMDLWEKYREIRAVSLANGGDGSEATEFYREHQGEMDKGAEAAWPERYEPGQISAIQYAMDIYFDRPAAFWSEYQNAPKPEIDTDASWYLTPDDIEKKTSGIDRGVVPLWATHLTIFIDVQQELLYWLAMAVGPRFDASIIDYGTMPEQPVHYFDLRTAPKRLKKPGVGVKGMIRAGLTELVARLATRKWLREDGSPQEIARIGVDARYQTDTIYRFCRESDYSRILWPSMGRGIGPSDVPMTEYRRRPGETIGLHWRLVRVQSQNLVMFQLDTNEWKTRLHQGIGTAIGDPGAITLFGSARNNHRLIAEHLTAEYPVEVSGRGRTMYQWKIRPNRDNHWLDCAAGALALASACGAQHEEIVRQGRRRRKITREMLR